MELVDGYDELPAPLQEKVERAFEQGHVDDDDWTGVSCAFWLDAMVTLTCYSHRTWR